MRAICAFLVSAALGASAQLAVSSCSEDGDDCRGDPQITLFPSPRAAAALTYIQGNIREELLDDLKHATIEIAERQLTVRYSVDGQAREVTYKILPSEWARQNGL